MFGCSTLKTCVRSSMLAKQHPGIHPSVWIHFMHLQFVIFTLSTNVEHGNRVLALTQREMATRVCAKIQKKTWTIIINKSKLITTFFYSFIYSSDNHNNTAKWWHANALFSKFPSFKLHTWKLLPAYQLTTKSFNLLFLECELEDDLRACKMPATRWNLLAADMKRCIRQNVNRKSTYCKQFSAQIIWKSCDDHQMKKITTRNLTTVLWAL